MVTDNIVNVYSYIYLKMKQAVQKLYYYYI